MQVLKTEAAVVITWPITYIPARIFAKIRNEVLQETDYKLLAGKKMAHFQQFIRVLASKYDERVDIQSALSIRNVVLKDKIVRRYSKMNQLISRISAEYNRSSVLELSARYDFPPLNLLRGILLFRQFCPKQVYDIFAGRKDPRPFLSGRNLAQYELALENDAEASFNQAEITKIAADNEAKVVSYFNSIGISMKNQADLVREQMAEHGRAVATPDILFTEPVYVNGTRVHWIDYKDYTATDIPFIFNSNVDQAARYVEKWGAGIMCYKTGVVQGVTIPSTFCLSAEHLPIKF